MIDTIATQSEAAFQEWSQTSNAERSRVLHVLADALEANRENLVALADEESRLGPGRLNGELTRTIFQARFFAQNILSGEYQDAVIDEADPDWGMGPRPDMRRIKIPLGPVVVFAASNFPFAFSVMGGDTVSALAAGCSVIVKAHSGHPKLSEAVSDAMVQALAEAGAPENLLQIVYATADGVEILKHPLIKAAGFTGSISGGRALFNVANERPEPIPFYGELGSVNPVLVTENGVDDVPAFVEAYLGSLLLGSGQFCTKPGLLFVPEGSPILEVLTEAELPAVHELLNPRILSGYVEALHEVSELSGVTTISNRQADGDNLPSVNILQTSAEYLLNNPRLIVKEVFGPTGMVVTYRNDDEALEALKLIDGQLTFTIFADEADSLVKKALPAIARIAGRLLWHQWPTGVSVTYAQQHGGPYPASTTSTSTSVGAAAIERFVRPVSYQGFPQSLLPEILRDEADASLVRKWPKFIQ